MSGSNGEGGAVVGESSIGDRHGDVATVSPVSDEVSSLGSRTLQGGGSMGIIGGQRGVVVHWVLGVLLSGFSLGRASLNPGLETQAEGEGVFSWLTLSW
jgi:hypothetical protein